MVKIQVIGQLLIPLPCLHVVLFGPLKFFFGPDKIFEKTRIIYFTVKDKPQDRSFSFFF